MYIDQTNSNESTIDPINLEAIEILEQFGITAPTEKQINRIEEFLIKMKYEKITDLFL